MCGEMAVHPVRLDQRHRRGDPAEQLVRNLRWRRLDRSRSRRRGLAVPLQLEGFEQAHETWIRRDDVTRTAFEQTAPLRRDRCRILEVVLEQISRIARVEAVDIHQVCCSRDRYQSGWLVITATANPTAKENAPMKTAAVARRALRPPIATASRESTSASGIRRSGRYATPVRLTKIPAA